MDRRLAPAIKLAHKVLSEWLKVRKGQKLLFMANPATDRDVLSAFSAAAGEVDAEIFVFVMQPHNDLMQEYPKPLAEAVKHVDVLFNLATRDLCQHRLTHQTALAEYGVRNYIMAGLTLDHFLSPAVAKVSAEQLKGRGDYLAQNLLGQKARFTTESGTDLSVEFDDDLSWPVYNYTFERGGLACLPGGATHLHPKDGSINGTIVCDMVHWYGDTGPKKVRFTIKEDWVTGVSGGPGNLAQQLWDEMKSTKNGTYMGELGFGLNPELKPGIKYPALGFDTRIGGSFHIGIGESIAYGGKIKSPMIRAHTICSPRIEVNGQVIVEKNRFLFEEGSDHG